MLNNSEALVFFDSQSWEAWLSEHHSTSGGIWLLIAKKGFEETGITIGDALDVALCYSWIDSHRKGYDNSSYLQRYSPKRKRSPWSKLNVERVAALIKSERMGKQGLAEVAAAQADGRWAVAYNSQRKAEIPHDFMAALNKNSKAKAAFETLDRSGRYVAILPVLKATSSEVRKARLRKAIADLER